MVSEELRDKYWNILNGTRQSGRISPSVEEALGIHISHYKTYKENYTIGIMRNLQKKKAEGVPVVKQKKNSFNNFHQRKYDYDELERQLINSSL